MKTKTTQNKKGWVYACMNVWAYKHIQPFIHTIILVFAHSLLLLVIFGVNKNSFLYAHLA